MRDAYIACLCFAATRARALSLQGRRVCVVGAGVGGLCAAGRLAREGARVTILERRDACGGRLHSKLVEGYRFDLGPSLLLMPAVYDATFAALGDDTPLETVDVSAPSAAARKTRCVSAGVDSGRAMRGGDVAGPDRRRGASSWPGGIVAEGRRRG